MQQARWTPVLDAAALVDGAVHAIQLGERAVVVVRRGEALHALAGLCPHDHAALSDGQVHGDELVCPRHGARFRLSDGVCAAGFRLPALPCYPVRVHAGRVEIDGAAVERNPPGPRHAQRWDLSEP